MLDVGPAKHIDATVRLPGSKSLTNRALLLSCLADGTSRLRGVLFSEDTRLMMRALQKLGFAMEVMASECQVSIQGRSGSIPRANLTLHLGNSGTCVRFLTCLATLADGAIVIDGNARMRQRPIGDLVRALAQATDAMEYLNAPNCPPLKIHGHGFAGGRIRIRGTQSSQYFSGILMIGPYAAQDLHLSPVGVLVSRPYVDMTVGLMERFGIEVNRLNGTYHVPHARCYRAREYILEPDASAASYFLGAAAILGGRVTLEGLGTASLQGDAGFAGVLEQMGCTVQMEPHCITLEGGALHGIDIDLNSMPDMVPTLAVIALFADGKTRIRNVANLRIKETDRLSALRRELSRLGAGVEIFEDGIVITPSELAGCTLRTYDDHRMAMSLYLVGLKVPGVRLTGETCVGKTYPAYFRDMSDHLER